METTNDTNDRFRVVLALEHPEEVNAMYWTRKIVIGTALLAGCTGTISSPGVGTGSGNTSGSGSGSSTGSGSGATTGKGSGGTTGKGSGGTAAPGSGGTSGSGSTTGSSSGGTTAPGSGGTAAPGSGGAPVDLSTCVPGIPATSQLPRLTHAQYDNTIRDLLGITNQPSAMLAPDGPGSVDQRAWDGYQTAASTLAPAVVADSSLLAKAVGCTPSGDGSACAMQFIQNFGQRAFRRPLSADEANRFLSLYTNRMTITPTGAFNEAVQVILQAFLVSPSFLTRSEVSTTMQGQRYVLSSYEVASRLSYMLWGTMPDDTLFASAAANKLSTPDGILAEATRMLASTNANARAQLSAFHQSYSLMGTNTRWSAAAHDSTVFPEFTVAMVPELTDEATRFFDYITFDQNGTFQDLITKPVAFVNKDLAPIYGLDPSTFGTDMTLTNLDPTQRAGVFTHAGFLGSYSSYNRTSPILRGAFLEKQILCRAMGSPPDGAVTTPLPTDASLDTNRKRVDQQTSADACTGCHHGIVNPAGFALEAYDGVGAYQTNEHDTNAAIDSTADVMIGTSTVHVSGPVDLMNQIAASPEAQACYSQRMVSYAYARDITSQDVCTVQSMSGKLSQGGYTVLNMITDLTQTDSFRFRATEAAP
jgi:hypothetical protein